MIDTRSALRAFYVVVLGVALTGAGQAATGWLDWWPLFAFAAVGAVELGGVVLSMHADVRRQLGERALAARLLSAAVATGAIAVNWFGHKAQLGQAAFFAGMSALGFGVWLIDSAARRRDALRRAGKLPPTPPVYGVVQWLRHPWLTRRARQLALIDPNLGLYGSLALAVQAVRTERRKAAISAALRDKITEATANPTMAAIAVNVYDPEEIAHRLATSADYDGLTTLIAADLTPAVLTSGGEDSPREVTAAVTPVVELSRPGHADGDLLDLVESVAGPLRELAAAPSVPYPLPREIERIAGVTVTKPAETAIGDPPDDRQDDGHQNAKVTVRKPPTRRSPRPRIRRHMARRMTVTNPPPPPPDDGHRDRQKGAVPSGTKPPKKIAKEPVKKASPRASTSAEKVARAAAKLPGAPAAQIAKKAGVSESTARRHLAALNGHHTTSKED